MTKWTANQEAILREWETGNGNLSVVAFPGAGKTTLIMEGIRRLTDKANYQLYLAFMKRNVEDAERKIKSAGVLGARAQTLNSAGAAMLSEFWRATGITKRSSKGKWRSDYSATKYKSLIDQVLEESALNLPYPVREDIRTITTMARAYLVDGVMERRSGTYRSDRPLYDLALRYNIKLKPEWMTVIKRVLDLGFESAAYRRWADFDDQIWVPILLGLEPTYLAEALYIDEAQDLTRAKWQLAKMHVSPEGKVMLAGDPYQAVMGFAGADYDSYDYGRALFNCTEMTVPDSFRFGPKLAAEAQFRVASLRGVSQDSLDQIIHTVVMPDENDYSDCVVIARGNLPLIRLAVDRLMRGRQSRFVKDNAFWQLEHHIKEVLDDIAKTKGSFANFIEYAESYRQKKIEVYESFGAGTHWFETLNEAMDAAIYIYKRVRPINGPHFLGIATSIFQSEEGLPLTTAHAAKGREWNTVFLLHPHRFIGLSGDQEENVRYVALTRARDTLIYIHDGQQPEYVPGLEANEV